MLRLPIAETVCARVITARRIPREGFFLMPAIETQDKFPADSENQRGMSRFGRKRVYAGQ